MQSGCLDMFTTTDTAIGMRETKLGILRYRDVKHVMKMRSDPFILPERVGLKILNKLLEFINLVIHPLDIIGRLRSHH